MKTIKQRLLGLTLILISFAVIALAWTGTTPEERDVTVILITLPLGIYSKVGSLNYSIFILLKNALFIVINNIKCSREAPCFR